MLAKNSGEDSMLVKHHSSGGGRMLEASMLQKSMSRTLSSARDRLAAFPLLGLA